VLLNVTFLTVVVVVVAVVVVAVVVVVVAVVVVVKVLVRVLAIGGDGGIGEGISYDSGNRGTCENSCYGSGHGCVVVMEVCVRVVAIAWKSS
jgi:hypothetical protein